VTRRTENVGKEVYLASTLNRMPSSISHLNVCVGALQARFHGAFYLCHLPACRRTTPKRSKTRTRRVPMAVAMSAVIEPFVRLRASLFSGRSAVDAAEGPPA